MEERKLCFVSHGGRDQSSHAPLSPSPANHNRTVKTRIAKQFYTTSRSSPCGQTDFQSRISLTDMNVELGCRQFHPRFSGNLPVLRVEDAIAPSMVCLWQTQREHSQCVLAVCGSLSGLLLILCASQSPFLQLRGDC